MSAVINRAKQQHLKAIKWEMGLIIFITFFLYFIKGMASFSFLAGALSSFLPHCAFVYWIFFKSAKNQQKVTAFYRSEGIKWLVAILLITASFTLVPNLQLLFYFVGYFLALCLNIMLPIMLNRHITSFL